MKTILTNVSECILCGESKLSTASSHRYEFPGETGNFLELSYERLWILFEYLMHSREPLDFNVMLCSRCGFMFTNPRFTQHAMELKYKAIEELGSVKKRLKARPIDKVAIRAEKNYRLFVVAAQLLNKAQNWKRILDYGGARGYMLTPFVKKGYDCFVLDYENWEDKVEPGVSYIGQGLSDLEDDEDRFDVILLLHTLEHMVDPVEFLREMTRFLSSEGVVIVEVPLGCFNEYKHLADPLTHVNFFSEESLALALKESGLNLVHISTSYQWVGHAQEWCVKAVATPLNIGQTNRIRSTLQQSSGFIWQWYWLQHVVRTLFRLMLLKISSRS